MEKKGCFGFVLLLLSMLLSHSSEETIQSLFIENNILATALNEVDLEFWEKIAESYNISVRNFNAHSDSSSQLSEQSADEIKNCLLKSNRWISKRYLWTMKEDEILKNHVLEYGNKDWEKCAQAITDSGERKTPEQCHERYIYRLSRRNHSPWSKKEDRLLKEKYAEFEDKWEKIALFSMDDRL